MMVKADMRIMLINPMIIDAPAMPLGMLYVVAVLEKAGHSVRVYGLSPTIEPNMGKILMKNRPDLVGVSKLIIQLILLSRSFPKKPMFVSPT